MKTILYLALLGLGTTLAATAQDICYCSTGTGTIVSYQCSLGTPPDCNTPPPPPPGGGIGPGTLNCPGDCGCPGSENNPNCGCCIVRDKDGASARLPYTPLGGRTAIKPSVCVAALKPKEKPSLALDNRTPQR